MSRLRLAVFTLLSCENRAPGVPWSLNHVVGVQQRLWNHTLAALLDAADEHRGQSSQSRMLIPVPNPMPTLAKP